MTETIWNLRHYRQSGIFLLPARGTVDFLIKSVDWATSDTRARHTHFCHVRLLSSSTIEQTKACESDCENSELSERSKKRLGKIIRKPQACHTFDHSCPHMPFFLSQFSTVNYEFSSSNGQDKPFRDTCMPAITPGITRR